MAIKFYESLSSEQLEEINEIMQELTTPDICIFALFLNIFFRENALV